MLDPAASNVIGSSHKPYRFFNKKRTFTEDICTLRTFDNEDKEDKL